MDYEKNYQTTSMVAWYKLADLIARKEREKALNVYRLLSHSFDDKAYALQLEGDILWSFDDNTATDRYKQAAFLYRKEKRLIDAICVCEHLLTLEPNRADIRGILLELYPQVDWSEHCHQLLTETYHLIENKKINAHEVADAFCLTLERLEEQKNGAREKLIKILHDHKSETPQSLQERLGSFF